MKLSFKALIVILTLLCATLEELSIDQAQAGVIVRRGIRTRYKYKPKKSTKALRATLGRVDGGDAFGSRKSMNKVYKARLKEYKIAFKMWQKEKKITEKLQKEYAKKLEKQRIQEAKERKEYAKKLAKIRERQQIELAEAREEGVTQDKENGSDVKSGDSTKKQSIFSKLTNKSESAKNTYSDKKTQFKKGKLKFMSRLFLSLFGKE